MNIGSALYKVVPEYEPGYTITRVQNLRRETCHDDKKLLRGGSSTLLSLRSTVVSDVGREHRNSHENVRRNVCMDSPIRRTEYAYLWSTPYIHDTSPLRERWLRGPVKSGRQLWPWGRNRISRIPYDPSLRKAHLTLFERSSYLEEEGRLSLSRGSPLRKSSGHVNMNTYKRCFTK